MKRRSGFTLIELLTAMAVTSLILVLVSQMVSLALSWANSSRIRMNSGDQARAIWQRLAFDLNARVDSPNLKAVKVNGGNDSLELLSDVRNTSGLSRFTKVSWQVAEKANPLTGRQETMLFRTLAPVEWDDDPSLDPDDLPTPAISDLFSEGVFRLEIAFLGKNGALTASPPASTDDIQALVVGAAILDANARLGLSESEILNLAAQLPDAVDGKTPVENWQVSAFGASIAPHVRFFQQTFFLNRP